MAKGVSVLIAGRTPLDSMNDEDPVMLKYWWDTADPRNPGWFVEYVGSGSGEHVVEDSMKVWFPVDVDQFGKHQEEDLLYALRSAFPADLIRKM